MTQGSATIDLSRQSGHVGGQNDSRGVPMAKISGREQNVNFGREFSANSTVATGGAYRGR